jgi:2-polyprenyl-3-methyl-5-hydroxy-6-metoxy-1,4-benzoquinol methylase
MVFRFPRPSPESLAELYDKSWMQPENNTSETGAMTSRLADNLLDALENTLKDRGMLPVSGGQILEFGAGTGALAQRLLHRGARVRTVEPFGHEALVKKGIDNVRCLSDLPDDVQFDGILSFDVVVHLSEPWVELEDLRKRLVSGGWILVSTPNVNGLNALLSRQRWREFRRPGHITLFSGKALVGLLRDVGFHDVRQVHWRIDYGSGVYRAVINRAVQIARMDGALRVFAVAP